MDKTTRELKRTAACEGRKLILLFVNQFLSVVRQKKN